MRISHIGSNTFDNIWAKEIVDILFETAGSENIEITISLKQLVICDTNNVNTLSTDKVNFNVCLKRWIKIRSREEQAQISGRHL